MGHGGGTPKKPLLPGTPAAPGPSRAGARREAALPAGRAGRPATGRPRVPVPGSGCAHLQHGAAAVLTARKRLHFPPGVRPQPAKAKPWQRARRRHGDAATTLPLAAAGSQDRRCLGLPRAAEAPHASASAHRPCAAPSAAGDTSGSARGSPLSTGPRSANPHQPSLGRVSAPALPSPCGSRCTAYFSHGRAAQCASSPGGLWQEVAGLQRLEQVPEPRASV